MSERTLLVTAFFPPKLGGLEHYWREAALRWPDQNIVVLTTPSAKPDPIDASVNVQRRSFFPLRFIRPSWLPLVRTIDEIVRREHVQRILFGHFANFALAGIVMHRFRHIPYDVVSHGVDSVLPLQSAFGRWALRTTLRSAQLVFANSEQTAEHLRTVVQRQVLVAPPAITFDAYPDIDRAVLRQRAGWTDRFVIAFLGRLVSVKGVDSLIKAVARVNPDLRPVLLLGGDGPERGHLEQLVADQNLQSVVKFAGRLPDEPKRKAEFFGAADVFVLPSRIVKGHQESFGLVCLEAARYRIPVIVSSASGATEFVKAGQTGYVVPPDQPESLGAVLEHVKKNPDEARQLANTLYEMVRIRYTWERTVAMLTSGL